MPGPNLTAVDLSSNALTTIQSMMVIALELPHLEVDLADNPWQCDDSMTVFQDFMSESWRKKWNEICNKSIGNEEAFWWTPKIRISRRTHLPHIHLNHMKKILPSQEERSQEAMSMSLSTSGKKERVRSDINKKQRRLPRWVRNAQDDETLGRREDIPDLTLAVCLSVFITFFVAFCLGALTRPYIDSWQQRCWNKSPGSKNTYSNEGFHDEIEAAGNIKPPTTFPHQAFHDLNLCENQDSVPVMPWPHTAVTHDRGLRSSRKGAGSWQSTTQCGNNTGAGNRNDSLLPNGNATHSILPRHPNADNNKPISAAQDHIYRNDILRELNYDTVAREDSLGGLGSQLEFSKETQMSTCINLLSTQQQMLKEASPEEEASAYYSTVTYSDPGDTDPSIFPPRRDSDMDVTPAHKEPQQNCVPSDTQVELETNYDSDEGSLFTLSSVSSEGTRNMTEDEAYGEESYRAREPPENENTGGRMDNTRSLESLEDNITFQNILEKCENQEDHFEKPLISGPDSEHSASTTVKAFVAIHKSARSGGDALRRHLSQAH
ncbi:LOW QUALITY PROTEIN: leucine-rich repeat-containing protein 66-like [Dugong dugon]